MDPIRCDVDRRSDSGLINTLYPVDRHVLALTFLHRWKWF